MRNRTHRLMFGGCSVYCEGKVVALISDDQLFIKPTQSGREYIGELVRRTERELPAPRPKKRRKTRVRGKKAAT